LWGAFISRQQTRATLFSSRNNSNIPAFLTLAQADQNEQRTQSKAEGDCRCKYSLLSTYVAFCQSITNLFFALL
jgi:hypothetical protein